KLSGAGVRGKSCRAEEIGGFPIEVKRCSRMTGQDCSWRHRNDFSLEAELYRLRFPRIRNDSNDFFGLEDLAHRHGNGLPGNFRNVREPAFTHLLAAAGFIESDNEISVLRLEIRRRIVERQMTVFSDAGKSNIDGR